MNHFRERTDVMCVQQRWKMLYRSMDGGVQREQQVAGSVRLRRTVGELHPRRSVGSWRPRHSNATRPRHTAGTHRFVDDTSHRRLNARSFFAWLISATDTVMCVVRRSNNTFGDRCFATAGPRLWNTLPAHLRQCDSLGQFKRLLKPHLFGSWDRGALWHFCWERCV